MTHTASTDLAPAYHSASPSCTTPSRHLGHGAISRLCLTPVGPFIRLGDKGQPNPSIRRVIGYRFSNRIRGGENEIRRIDVCVYRGNSTDLAGIGTAQLDNTVLVLLPGAVIRSSIAVFPKIHSSVDASSDNFGWVAAPLGVRA